MKNSLVPKSLVWKCIDVTTGASAGHRIWIGHPEGIKLKKAHWMNAFCIYFTATERQKAYIYVDEPYYCRNCKTLKEAQKIGAAMFKKGRITKLKYFYK